MELFRAKEQFDILVVGAGLAGIRAAVSCSKEGKKVLLLSSAKLCSGSSFYPLMDTLHVQPARKISHYFIRISEIVAII